MSGPELVIGSCNAKAFGMPHPKARVTNMADTLHVAHGAAVVNWQEISSTQLAALAQNQRLAVIAAAPNEHRHGIGIGNAITVRRDLAIVHDHRDLRVFAMGRWLNLPAVLVHDRASGARLVDLDVHLASGKRRHRGRARNARSLERQLHPLRYAAGATPVDAVAIGDTNDHDDLWPGRPTAHEHPHDIDRATGWGTNPAHLDTLPFIARRWSDHDGRLFVVPLHPHPQHLEFNDFTPEAAA